MLSLIVTLATHHIILLAAVGSVHGRATRNAHFNKAMTISTGLNLIAKPIHWNMTWRVIHAYRSLYIRGSR
ncbi:hypothetical protein GGR51DRAFT_110780 [Nemania sp. FL0031]|nr:hypothetical protein GGR51DRAFT_110780 [Nemania sp. FL0031]